METMSKGYCSNCLRTIERIEKLIIDEGKYKRPSENRE